MARIRSVKPDFWDSPSTARASLRARLFYIAMWNWADDWGVGDANPRRLLSFAFPNDESSDVEPRNFRRLAEEVAECFGVLWYEVDGRPYFQIPSWEEHQRTEKKAKRANPGSDQAERILYAVAAEVPTPSSGNVDDGSRKGEVGKGKWEEGELPRSPATPSSTHASRFDEFWAAYPRKVGKDKARPAYVAAAKRADEQTVIDGATRLAQDPNLPEAQYIPHPTTWLARGGWQDEPLPARRLQHTTDRQGELLRAEHARLSASAEAHTRPRQEISA